MNNLKKFLGVATVAGLLVVAVSCKKEEKANDAKAAPAATDPKATPPGTTMTPPGATPPANTMTPPGAATGPGAATAPAATAPGATAPATPPAGEPTAVKVDRAAEDDMAAMGAAGTPMTPADEKEMLGLIKEVTDAVCACKDMQCMQDLGTKMGPRMQKFAAMKPSPEFMEKMQEASKKTEECLGKLMGEAGGPGGPGGGVK